MFGEAGAEDDAVPSPSGLGEGGDWTVSYLPFRHRGGQAADRQWDSNRRRTDLLQRLLSQCASMISAGPERNEGPSFNAPGRSPSFTYD